MGIIVSSTNSNQISRSVASNIGNASSKVDSISQRLATGKAIIKASDDPAGLSVGTGLKIAVSTLNTTLKGAGQAQAVLGVADGALSGIQEQLEKLKSLAAQSNNGSVSGTQRDFFNLQFQQSVAEIDRLTTDTTFNNQILLNGSLSGGANFASNTTSAVDSALSAASITFGAGNSAAAAVGAFTINGVSFDFGAATAVNGANIVLDQTLTGANIATTIASIINNTAGGTLTYSNMNEQNYERLSDLVATVNGNTLNITNKRSGVGGEFLVTVGTTNVAANVTAISNRGQTQAVTAATAYSMVSSIPAGSTTGSLGVSSMVIEGSINGSIIPSLTQTEGNSGWVTISSLNNATTLSMFGTTLTLEDTVVNTGTQILVGASDYETAKNIAAFLNNSTDSNIANYFYEVQLTAAGATQIKASAKGATAITNGAVFTIGGATGTITGGATAGLDVSHITDNASFLGTLSNFSAKMIGTDSVTLSVTAGDYIYQANVLDTNPTADYTIRMKSTDLNGKGGWFDLTIAANRGVAVAVQDDADTFAKAINTALEQLSFYQNREISSFDPTGTFLENSVVSMTAKTFSSSLNVSSINVVSSSKSSNQDGSITVTLNDGRVFSNTTLGTQTKAGTQIKLTNINDGNENISIIFASDVYYDTDTNVSLLNNTLNTAFKAGQNGMTFQVGTQSDQTVNITIGDARSATLFGNQALNVGDQQSATNAATVIEKAINTIIALRASIGSFQARFDSVIANIQISIENSDAARSIYLDADTSTESTNLALATAQRNAAISVLAQTNDLPESLLQLLR